MKNLFRIFWLLPVLALSVTVRGDAQQPASGRILILTNDRVLEGDIDKVGGQYRIRRGMSETLIDAERAKYLCLDWDDALRTLRSQANLGDPDERLRLAQWCLQHHLKAQALVEARAALEMRPTHGETKQLLQILTRPPVPLPATVAPGKSFVADQGPRLDVSADCVVLFTTKVQPILMNACGGCHGIHKGGDFVLEPTGENSSRATTHRNLAATLKYLRLETPAASPLLAKAVSAHGASAQSPIRDRKAPAFLALLHWADQVAVNNPHLRATAAVGAPAPRSSPETTVSLPSPATQDLAAAPIVSRSLPRNDNQGPTNAPSAGPAANVPPANVPPALVPPGLIPPGLMPPSLPPSGGQVASGQPAIATPNGATPTEELPTGPANVQQALLRQQSPVAPRVATPAPQAAPANPRDPFDPAEFNRVGGRR